MSYSIDALTNSCYEGTTCLINKLGIRYDTYLRKALREIISPI